MRIVVTGASGNLGSALLRRLRFEQDDAGRRHTLVGVARRPPIDPVGDDEWVPIDIADPDSETELARTFLGADAVVHLAWMLQPQRKPGLLQAANVDGARRVLDAAVEAGVPHTVVISSVGAYAPGPKDREVDETWPATGVRSSLYSRQKADVERLLDDVEREHPDLVVSRIRPGLVFQAGAASEIARLFLGPLVPTRLIGRVPLPVVPLPRSLVFQVVHADDVGAAIATVLRARAGGAFNVATDPPLGPAELGAAVRALVVPPVPAWALRLVVRASWRFRLQPTEPGWLDLATQVPVMSTRRLRELGWEPAQDARDTLRELMRGLARGSGNNAYRPLVERGAAPAERG